MSKFDGVCPWNVPVHHRNGRWNALEGRLRVGEVALRCVVCGLAVLVAALVGTDTQVKKIVFVERKAKFTDMKASVFLVIFNGIAACYSLIQGLRCVVTLIRGNVLLNKPVAWLIFSCDQVMAYVSVAAVAATTQSGLLAEFGQPELQWMKLCDMYRGFCIKAGCGLMIAFVVTCCILILSCISAFNLFRLYGNNKR
ncbi:CASP-like protein 2B1 [Elaeis guineensis]|uniref:CASP-like protein n=1 Tax=Elaeis guineensis var. tenera TaxID=51953 RepID=A0A6I9QY47_ELAGV|nr:CASP-like protein 2B1 [Elaeis guineensis]